LLPKWKKPFRHYVHDPQAPNTLARGEVTNFFQDKDGVLWITHFLGGISLLRGRDKLTFPYNASSAVRNGNWGEEDDQLILSRPLNRNSTHFTHITHDPKNPASMSRGGLFGICEDRYGYIWLAITPDLNRLDRKTASFKHFIYDLSNPKSHAWTFTLCCCEDRQGTMWFGTSNAGLERFNRADETFDRFCTNAADSSSISSNRVQVLYQDKAGKFWIGTDQGLCRLVYDNMGKEKFIRYQHHPSQPESITGNDVTAIYEDRNRRLWIGTEAGLNLFDREKKSFKAITERDGLPSNSIVGILEDDQGLSEGRAGNLWLRTTRGIVKFNTDTGSLRVYDERDGLIYCKSILEGFAAFYKGSGGEIYSGGANSVAVFHPDSLKDNPDPPKIVLTDFKINYESVKIGSDSPLKESVTFTDRIKLAYDQNIISFEFAALDYTSPRKNLYAYKLEGINADWVYTDASHRSATYTKLDAGEYVFRVKGSNNDGVWNEDGASVRIMITPPWWKTRWAFASYVSMFVAFMFGIIRFEVNRHKRKAEAGLREEQERRKLEVAEHRAEVAELQAQAAEAQKEVEKEQMRSRIASDLHDEIGSNLSSIAIISQMLEKKLKLAEPEKHRLQEIPRIARSTAESMRDIIWFINPENDSMDKLMVKMRETANLLLESVDFTFLMPEAGIAFEAEIDFRRNLYLIYKEILQNIIKHAQATKVEITIYKSDQCFGLRVADNGIGFDPAKEYLGNGLKNFQRRAMAMGGTVEVTSSKGHGSNVTLTVRG
jgi:signal transduction histidine kinase